MNFFSFGLNNCFVHPLCLAVVKSRVITPPQNLVKETNQEANGGNRSPPHAFGFQFLSGRVVA